jgi:hypothetical protein
MASASVLGKHGLDNLYHSLLLGALGLSPRCGGDLRVLFLFGRRVANIADHMIRRAWTSPFFHHLFTRNFPLHPRFLRRPRLLTRL